MRILTDYHHADLAHSFALTFGRFGWEVRHPYGMAWFPEYWAFEQEWHGDAVARQYLLGIWAGAEPVDGQVETPDTRHPGYTIRGLTLEAARDWRPDIIISSVPANAPGFSRLAREIGTRWGIHVGNQWGNEAWELTPDFAILSTTSPVPAGIPHVIVHQEFSLDDFRYEPPVGFGPIKSYVNCFPEMQSEYAGNFLPIARAYPEFKWEVYGAYGTAERDEFAAGELHGTAIIGDSMRAAGVCWFAKHWSDGYGHICHNQFAVGRPVFGYQRYYEDKMAGPLWVDGVTSFDVEKRSDDEVITILRKLRDEPGYYLSMCESVAARFREIVSFDEDAELVRGLIERVAERVAA